MPSPRYLTIQYIREELQDRTPGDNSIDCDLAFSDEEIMHAMERAAQAYNSMAPIGIDVVAPNALLTSVGLFLDCVLSKLYGSAIHKLARNQMQWQTGDVTVELEKTRMTAYQQLQQLLEKEWREAARERKMEINRSLVWGSF